MKWSEIKNFGEEEIKEELEKAKAELVDLKFKAHAGALKHVHKIGQRRKDMARMLLRLSEIKKQSKI